MEEPRHSIHQHKWRELERSWFEQGEGGFVTCECGEQEFLDEHELTEFRHQRRLGIEPVIDDDGLRSLNARP